MLSDLTFHSLSQNLFPVHSAHLSLLKQTDAFLDCRLTFQVSPALYHHLDNNALFNLKPEFRTVSSHGNFIKDHPIQLEVTLQPDLLPLLLEHAQTNEAAMAYLLVMSQQLTEQFQSSTLDSNSEKPSHDTEASLNPLLNTESWFCLSVKQQQDSGETGYTTFWNYVNPAILNHPETASEQVAEGITNFVKDLTAANLTAATQDLTADLLKGVTTLFDGFESWLDNAFSKDGDDDTDGSQDDAPILETVIEFFTEDDWTFTKLQGQPVLHVAYQGKNGTWNCYAQAREPQEQLVFYSIYPELVPEDKRLAMAEFLARANYGLIIGNFEVDFNDGDIRYKTGIDVEGDILTSQLVKQLVYANVMMMDHYFPGIEAVLEGKLSPKEAIDQIEGAISLPTTNAQDQSAP